MTEPSSGERHPERFGTYRILDLLGTGGMGRVYRALDEALQREVAIKTLLPALAADGEFVTRFTREARSAAALNHPNITQIYAIGQEGEAPYFAMELIRGQSLEALAKERGALDPWLATGYIRQAAAGLRHAAQKGLIHRDVKPSNLMLAEDGVVKITDFGLAKAAASDTRLTATGEVLGSPGYISPEQAQGLPIDLRSDIYSLGSTFYHLVTGRLPFEASTAVAMIMKHMNEPVRSPRSVNAGIPFPVAAVIQKMMAKKPTDRFQDYDALVRELDRVVGEAQMAISVPGDPGRAATRRMNAAVFDGTAGHPPRGGRVPGLARTPAGGRAPAGAPMVPPAQVSRHSLALLPVGLLIAVLALVIAGIWQQVQATRGGDGPGQIQGGRPTATDPRDDATVGRATTSPATPGAVRSETPATVTPQGPPPKLVFLSNDHDYLPQGGLRVMGKVQNSGGQPARNGRLRVRLMLESGVVAAQAETPLDPPIIAPGATATFQMDMDYSGPLGTLNAELIWTN